MKQGQWRLVKRCNDQTFPHDDDAGAPQGWRDALDVARTGETQLQHGKSTACSIPSVDVVEGVAGATVTWRAVFLAVTDRGFVDDAGTGEVVDDNT